MSAAAKNLEDHTMRLEIRKWDDKNNQYTPDFANDLFAACYEDGNGQKEHYDWIVSGEATEWFGLDGLEELMVTLKDDDDELIEEQRVEYGE